MRAQKEDLLRKPTTTFYGRLPRALSLKIESLAWLQLWSLGPKKLQGVNICSLINYTTVIFSSELIWIDWSTQKVANFWFSKSFFYVKTQQNTSHFFFIEDFKIRRITFISDIFSLFSFLKHSVLWNRGQFLACSNQFWWKNNWSIIYLWAPTPSSLFGAKLHDCNHSKRRSSYGLTSAPSLVVHIVYAYLIRNPVSWPG